MNLSEVVSHADFRVKYQPKPKPKILSLGGGGVRGMATITILAEVEKRIQAKIGEVFDLGAGTSVGSLIWSALSLRDEKEPEKTKYSANELVTIFEEKIQTIFHNTFLHQIESGYGLMRPKYKSDGIIQVLDEIFGPTLAKDLKGEFCFTAFNASDFEKSAFQFTKAAAQLLPSWSSLTVKEMLLSTTAAPTYFEPRQVILERKHTLLDGGISENNPAPRAYAHGKALFSCQDDMTLFSIETGAVNYSLNGEMNWGDLQWAPNMLPAFFAGQDSTARTLTQDFLNLPGQERKFFDIQFQLEKGRDSLDDASPRNLAYLKEVAKAWLDDDKNIEMLEILCQKIRPAEIETTAPQGAGCCIS